MARKKLSKEETRQGLKDALVDAANELLWDILYEYNLNLPNSDGDEPDLQLYAKLLELKSGEYCLTVQLDASPEDTLYAPYWFFISELEKNAGHVTDDNLVGFMNYVADRVEKERTTLDLFKPLQTKLDEIKHLPWKQSEAVWFA